MSDDGFDGLVDSPEPIKKKQRKAIAVESDVDSDSDVLTSPEQRGSALGLERFAYSAKPTSSKPEVRVNATTDSGWISRVTATNSPDYYQGRKVLKKGGSDKGNGKQKINKGRLKKKKNRKESSDESEGEASLGDSSSGDEDEVIDLEADSEEDKVQEEESIGSSDSEEEEGNSDEEAEVIAIDDDSDEDQGLKLSKAAKEKLAACRRISVKLSAALGKLASNGPKPDETGCLAMTELVGESDEDEVAVSSSSSRSRVWQPVSASFIEAQCEGLSALKPYQTVGVNWLLLLNQQNVSGVLADDMGLGKTVQTIAFFAMLRYNVLRDDPYAATPCHLVVVPASVLQNWMGELEKFAPHLSVVAYHGSVEARDEARTAIRRGSERGEPVDVVVTTYGYFERESSSDDRRFLRSVNFEYLVLDEAHGVKNMKTARWAHLKSVKTSYRLLLSGTPVQNNLRELMVLLDFLSPHVFNFKNTVNGWGEEDKSDPVGEFLVGLGLTEQGTAHAGGEDSLLQIRTLLAPFVLRRVKTQVLKQLAPKTSHDLTLVPDARQKQIYDGILRRHIERVTQRKTAKKSGKAVDLNAMVGNQKECRNVFSELRKAANHPLLLREHFKDPKKMELMANRLYNTGFFGETCTIEMVRTELNGYCDLDLHQICVEVGGSLQHLELPTETLFESCKMNKLRVMVPQLVSEGHRVLIFSQWTKLLDILELLLYHLAIGFERLDGSTPVGERQDMINAFNSAPEDKKVFLLSTRAGGLGINLTSADTVIIHDVDFNPVNDRQAEDRCHRIGQTKPVTVYKLVTEGTVDARILEIGTKKSEVNSTVLDSAPDKEQKEGQTMSALLKEALKSFLS